MIEAVRLSSSHGRPEITNNAANELLALQEELEKSGHR